MDAGKMSIVIWNLPPNLLHFSRMSLQAQNIADKKQATPNGVACSVQWE
jgi:hypothetical protein